MPESEDMMRERECSPQMGSERMGMEFKGAVRLAFLKEETVL